MVGFVTRRPPMDFVQSGREEGGFAIEGQAQVARVKLGPIEVGPIEVSTHGE